MMIAKIANARRAAAGIRPARALAVDGFRGMLPVTYEYEGVELRLLAATRGRTRGDQRSRCTLTQRTQKGDDRYATLL